MSENGDEIVKPISIGLIVGGPTPENEPWKEEIMILMNEFADSRAQIVVDINVNLEFHVPGPVLSPEFAGVRWGRYFKKENLLKIQVAVPEEAPQNPRSAVLDLVENALDEVDAWAVKKRRAVRTSALRELLVRARE